MRALSHLYFLKGDLTIKYKYGASSRPHSSPSEGTCRCYVSDSLASITAALLELCRFHDPLRAAVRSLL
jgi:hypothetical protein